MKYILSICMVLVASIAVAGTTITVTEVKEKQSEIIINVEVNDSGNTFYKRYVIGYDKLKILTTWADVKALISSLVYGDIEVKRAKRSGITILNNNINNTFQYVDPTTVGTSTGL